MKPLVTVLMPVYNAEKYLEEAIESILNQTYKNFYFLIINDGSIDNSLKIIQNYSKKDSRIKVITRDNKGLVATLNEGLDAIDTKYIVRMDADDISLPIRLEKQVEFMERHENIVVSGTNIRIFGEGIKTYEKKMPTDSLEIKAMLLFECCIMHPTVIIRKNIIDIEKYKYNSEYNAVEDFGLWQLISKKYYLSNINEVLLEYRVLESSITQKAEKDEDNRDRNHIKIYKQAFSNFDLRDEEFFILRKFIKGRQKLQNFEIEKIYNLRNDIIRKLGFENNVKFFLDDYISKKILDTLKYDLIENTSNCSIKKKIMYTRELKIFSLNSKYGILQRSNFIIIKILIKFYFKIKNI
jgi:glycosyltransferase involved in cell wall biosynthesis